MAFQGTMAKVIMSQIIPKPLESLIPDNDMIPHLSRADPELFQSVSTLNDFLFEEFIFVFCFDGDQRSSLGVAVVVRLIPTASTRVEKITTLGAWPTFHESEKEKSKIDKLGGMKPMNFTSR